MTPLGDQPYQGYPALVGRVLWSRNTGNFGLITDCFDDRDGFFIETTFSTPKGLIKGGFWAVSFMKRFLETPEKVVVYLLDKDESFVFGEPLKPELQHFL
jgi:hypothetical protein